MLKIVTYNVNGIRQRITQFGSLLKLLDSLDADIICFQEIKLTKQEVTADLIMAEGYESFFSCTRTSGKGRTGYSGVATFCRVKSAFGSSEVALPVAAEEGFTGLLEVSRGVESRSGEAFADMDCLEEFQRDELLKIDSEGRCVITDHGHFVLFNVYGPRADPDDAERVQFKANFYKIMQKRWELLHQEKRRIIVVGDLNIAPLAIDRCDAGPDFEKNEFRIWLRSMFTENGGSFLDVFREKHPERKDAYTHWSVHNGAEEFNYGSRIDHIIASGGCFHHVDNNEDHNLVACHVHECDIMTEFRRWKPGMLSRWKGGRPTKLEGSDHVPVFATLKDLPDIQKHNTPSLSARYIPEIRGSQQTIVSVFMKRKMSEPLRVGKVPSSATAEEEAKNIQSTLQSCTTSSVLFDETSSSSIDTCDYAVGSSSSIDTCDYAVGSSKDTQDVRKKKKPKQNNKSQLSLTSFFQKVPVSKNNVEHSTKDASNNEVNQEELVGDGKEPDISESALAEENNMLTANRPENSKNNAALLGWQRIQQLMQDSIPLCEEHREPCVVRVVKKPGPTFGRRFYVCARGEGPSSNPETRCDFFRWAGSKPKLKK